MSARERLERLLGFVCDRHLKREDPAASPEIVSTQLSMYLAELERLFEAWRHEEPDDEEDTVKFRSQLNVLLRLQLDTEARIPRPAEGKSTDPAGVEAAEPTLPRRYQRTETSALRSRVRPGPRPDDPYRAEHEQLSRDLLSYAQTLKRNNLLFQDSLRSDAAVMAEAEHALGGSSGKLEREGRRLKDFSRGTWTSTCRTVGVLVTVLAVFFLVLLFIQVSSKK
jgi:hypothetical protein